MNPRPVFLSDGHSPTPVPVPALLVRDIDPQRLDLIENVWGPVRGIVRAEVEGFGQSMEHSQWDWRNKADRVAKGLLLLAAVECNGEIQGLMAIAARPRYSVLAPGVQSLYVDYIEKAPTNIRTPGTLPRYAGIGSVLLADAIFRSRESGCEGRIGLHSLQSAEDFYRTHCGMADLGADPAYYYLRYFEYSATAATAWLERSGAAS